VDAEGKYNFYFVPGVPFEMKNLIESEVIPRIVERFKRPYIVHKTILTYGVGESLLAEQIENWENNLPSFIKLAYLPSPGRVRLRLTAKGDDEILLRKTLDEETINFFIGDIIVGFEEEETLEVIVGKHLKEKNKTIATAESCTGGKIAQVISSVAGASSYFKGSVVTYSTESKIDVLKVSPQIIKNIL
jgi:nicotinamide-nucleotide amidase